MVRGVEGEAVRLVVLLTRLRVMKQAQVVARQVSAIGSSHIP